MDRVAVIMSTFNGERYIAEQIESILKQKRVEVILYIRDDGSQDNTVAIIKKIQKTDKRIILIEGENIGWKRSFLTCLKQAGDADYYAFSDQDDVWLPDKLYKATEKLAKKKAEVALYAGNVWVADEKLDIIRSYHPENKNMLERPFQQLIIQDGMPGGLTYVFTPSAKKMLLRLFPGGTFGHDYLLFRVCLYFGEVVYDSIPYVLYRQHGNNVIGASKNFVWWIQKKVNTLKSKASAPISEAAGTFLSEYSAAEFKDKDVYEFLIKLRSYPKTLATKLKLIMMPEVKRQRKVDTLLLYMKILMGKL